ncbi:hypothetical protein IE53DRAFT_332893 [Violaceomyces palustris]|uniref:Uncharacterized protein n=1 Tax=Violaceomyces palustris TaxID=1673888 RepID=A0ACD0NSY9_9BASI|nr:hypothetical protein IE53DRAFT_332893 [Violaceomyces palustris]
MPQKRRPSKQRTGSPSVEKNTSTALPPMPSNLVASSSLSVPDGHQGNLEPPQDIPSADANIQLLTEHLGFNPRAYIDSLVYLANEHLYNLASGFEEYAQEELKEVEGGDLEAEQGVHAILTLLENALDHTFDTFELYCLRAIFGITPRQASVLTLPHHRGLDLRPASAKESGNTEIRGDSERPRKSSDPGVAQDENSAFEESHRLSETERAVRRRLNAARSAHHALNLAKQVAATRLSRTKDFQARFALLLRSTDRSEDVVDGASETSGAATGLPVAVSHQARKLRVDAATLLRALKALRQEDPLGGPLFERWKEGSSMGNLETGDPDNDGSGVEPRAWEKGREAYLNWEAERIIGKAKSRKLAEEHAEEGTTDASSQATDKEIARTAWTGKSASGRKRKSSMTVEP